ncbi:hypothetical protein HMPREF1584_00373 [Gardnerella vaginalis JCP8481A]|nr:hypothetical protein HMPREF1584_00373 [Gardnerella vaginalis JCP8481A]
MFLFEDVAILLGFLSVFPAYAGVILAHRSSAPDTPGLSRIRGGDPKLSSFFNKFA